jgi:hypothetical protein
MPGEVFLKNYDDAVMMSLANTILDYSDDSGSKVSKYTKLARKIDGIGRYVDLEIPNTIKGDNVPVIFSYPMDIYQNQIIPSIVVERSDVAKNMARFNGYGATQTCQPSEFGRVVATTEDGKVIYNKYTKQKLPIPFDISYSININGIFRNQVMDIFNDIMKSVFAVNGIIKVIDSIGDERLYDVYIERVSEAVEYINISQRKVVMTIDLRVEGELDYGVYDINEKWDETVVLSRIINVNKIQAGDIKVEK